ncbi:hypothetical protein [Pseudoteredinibacter isoporae]|uniref:Uncharacterized protein n=1 Tax=Pseudoteredinibacter isoporae TaxID=570281 RepID=A0A7X0JU70_9GAMM|nr:hypothetical protein [Pseudoteredinibacter isoporae]MBB6522343.1 hypothetical protein [Pseudoteredinibacter isoporae]NHO87876.1 hypothetical protein [Pseudoteredinibacter isoporae]NIB23793.1 hypothetical protein [Pseudoteredinibacter isoporae]
MKTTENRSKTKGNVIDLFTGQKYAPEDSTRFIRLAPELDGLEMLYSNDASPDKLFSLKVLCWGLRANGDVVGLVPWLNDIVACIDIKDPLNGQWEGYYDPGVDEVFYDAPIHKIVELETAAEYYDYEAAELNGEFSIQEIPDTIGTHAVLADKTYENITLTEVISWRLYGDGKVSGMVADESEVVSTPVLPGDECLYQVQSREEFRYFFQHQIANRIKAEDPEALAAISILVEEK